VTRLLGQRLQRHVVAAVVMQRVEQSDQVAARGAEAGPGGKVGDRRHLEAVADAMRPQRLAGQFVPQFVDVVHHLALRVVQADLAADGRAVDRHVHVLVQPHREDEATVLRVIRGEVGSATAEGDAEGGTRNDHNLNPAALASL
jgi:hypothetical protein